MNPNLDLGTQVRAITIKSEVLSEVHEESGQYAAESTNRHTRISGKRIAVLLLPGLLFFDILLLLTSFGATRLFSDSANHIPAFGDAIFSLISITVVLTGGYMLLAGMFGLFNRRVMSFAADSTKRSIGVSLWSGIVVLVFSALLAMDPPSGSRHFLLIQAVCLGLGALMLRPWICGLLMRSCEVDQHSPRRILIIGSTPEARRVAAVLDGGGSSGIRIAGLVDNHNSPRIPGQRWPRFTVDNWAELKHLAPDLSVQEVIVATPRMMRGEAVELAVSLAKAGIETNVVPHLTQLYVVAAPTRKVNSVPVLSLRSLVPNNFGNHFKRLFDLITAFVLCVFFFPVMLLIAIAVKLTSSGPILYGQVRVGSGGERFKMLKFRSMKVSNDDSGHRQYVESMMQGDAAGFDPTGRPVYKILNDPRVTLIGRILRQTSLDELPQLFNVLRGEMTLVGPRPCMPFEYKLYEPWQRRRSECTPGMTGLWQVSGRSLLSFEEMVLLDLYYMANWSFVLDLKLLWRTIPEVLYTRGAR